MTDPSIFLTEHPGVDYSSPQMGVMWMPDTAMARPEREERSLKYGFSRLKSPVAVSFTWKSPRYTAPSNRI